MYCRAFPYLVVFRYIYLSAVIHTPESTLEILRTHLKKEGNSRQVVLEISRKLAHISRISIGMPPDLEMILNEDSKEELC